VDTFERVREIIADITQNPLSDITENSTSRSVDGWDAAAQVNILVSIEMDFGIAFDPDETESLSSVRRIMQALKVQAVA
jgi:acyl carrier protein